MPSIEIDFTQYLPGLSTFFSFFEVLKEHHFIEDIKVIIQSKGLPPVLRVFRHEELPLV